DGTGAAYCSASPRSGSRSAGRSARTACPYPTPRRLARYGLSSSRAMTRPRCTWCMTPGTGTVPTPDPIGRRSRRCGRTRWNGWRASPREADQQAPERERGRFAHAWAAPRSVEELALADLDPAAAQPPSGLGAHQLVEIVTGHGLTLVGEPDELAVRAHPALLLLGDNGVRGHVGIHVAALELCLDVADPM